MITIDFFMRALFGIDLISWAQVGPIYISGFDSYTWALIQLIPHSTYE